jgi:hypothetical protein
VSGRHGNKGIVIVVKKYEEIVGRVDTPSIRISFEHVVSFVAFVFEADEDATMNIDCVVFIVAQVSFLEQ